MKIVILLSLVLLLGCTQRREYINIYDQSVNSTLLPCLGLDLMSADSLRKEITPLYHFKKDCEYKISLESRGGIVCNSSFNSSLKTSSNFPNSYLRLELKKGMKLLFSYYADLTSPPDSSDIKRAFEVLREKVKLP